MEFGYFILLIGLILTIIGIIVNNKGMLEPKNPNCPDDIYNAKQTKRWKNILLFSGSIITIISIILIIFG